MHSRQVGVQGFYEILERPNPPKSGSNFGQGTARFLSNIAVANHNEFHSLGLCIFLAKINYERERV